MHVVAHVAVSLDGATTGFEPDVGRFYELVATWSEDVTLAGADTILAQEAALTSAPRPGPAEGGPLLAVVDSRARVSEWKALREVGHWSDAVALRSSATTDDVPEIVTGGDRVDLTAALAELGERYGARTVRVDSGGALTGALLAAGRLDEVSLLVHPCLADGRRWYGTTPPPAKRLTRIAVETFDGDLTWLRYRIG